MKYSKKLPLVFLILVVFSLKGWSQSQSELLILPGNGAITLKEVDRDTIYFIPVEINRKINTGDITITYSDANSRSQTASLGKDYDYIAASNSLALTPTDRYFSVGIIVYARNIKSDPRTFSVTFTYKIKNQTFSQNLAGKIEPFNPIVNKKEFPDTSKWKVRIVTGSNFDFFDSPTFKNFAGDLNIFIPNAIKWHNKSIGFQAGIFNYRYFEADSSKGRIQIDKYLLDPAVTQLTAGTTKYVSETYALNNRTNFNTFGAYFNPMVALNGFDNQWINIYVNLHFEALWRTQILEDTKISLRKDTVLLSQNDVAQGIVLQSYPGLRPTYTKKSFNDTYVGVGLPIRLDIKKAFDFFIAPTIGWVKYEGTDIATRIENGIRYRNFTEATYGKFFILTKAQLVTSVTPVDIAMGGEFRKIAGEKTFYAVYLGASVSLDKLKK